MRLLLSLIALVLLATVARAQEVIPEPPTRFFNDYALAVRRETAEALNDKLADFERETSNQFLVCIYPKMQTASSIEDYTGRVARS